MAGELDDGLAELRTLAARLRAETERISEEAELARGALESQRDEIQRQRDEAQREAARAARLGQLGAARKELQKRLDRGQTTWRDVMTGADAHWSSKEVRQELEKDLVSTIHQLAEDDPEFASDLNDRLERSSDERDS